MLTKSNKTIYWSILACFLSGCVSISAQSYYPDGRFPSTNPKEVKIFRDVPPRPHTVIGEVYIENYEYMEEPDRDELKKKIAEIGGDAAIPDCKDQLIPATSQVETNHDLTNTKAQYFPVRTEWKCSPSSYKIIKFDSE